MNNCYLNSLWLLAWLTGLSLLRNQTETLATQAKTSKKKKKKRLGYLKLTLRALRTALLIGYALIITQQYDSTLIVIFNLTLIFYDVCNFRYVFYRLNKIIIINIILLLPNP